MSVGLAVLYHHSVIAFWNRHGRDVTTTLIWALEFAMTDRDVRIEDADVTVHQQRLGSANAFCELPGIGTR